MSVLMHIQSLMAFLKIQILFHLHIHTSGTLNRGCMCLHKIALFGSYAKTSVSACAFFEG